MNGQMGNVSRIIEIARTKEILEIEITVMEMENAFDHY